MSSLEKEEESPQKHRRTSKQLLLNELMNLSKQQILEVITEFCSSPRHNLGDHLLIHVQKWKDQRRSYSSSEDGRFFFDVQLMMPLVSRYIGPLATHVLAMTSAVAQGAYQLCKVSCEEQWRVQCESKHWQPYPCEKYYFWRLNSEFDDDETEDLLKSLLVTNGRICYRSGRAKCKREAFTSSRAMLIRRVIADCAITAKPLGSLLVKAWNLNVCKQGRELLIDAGARVCKSDACFIRGVGRECDGVYIRGNTLEGVMGKVGATEEDDQGDDDICRLIDFCDDRWLITNVYTGEVFCFLDEVPECMTRVRTSWFRESEDDESDSEEDDEAIARRVF